MGSLVGASNAQASAGNVQYHYDAAYAQCMTAKGNSVQVPQGYAGGYGYPGYGYGYPVGYAGYGYGYPYAYPYPYYGKHGYGGLDDRRRRWLGWLGRRLAWGGWGGGGWHGGGWGGGGGWHH